MNERYLEFKGEKICYSVSGKGRAIVLLHGFLGSKEIFKKIENKLSNRFKLVLVDLPGHGKSSCLGYVHTMEMMAQCVKAVLDNLQLRRYVLMGHSMGGYISLAFAELFPDAIKGIGLINSSAYCDSEEKKKDRERAIELVKKNSRVYSSNTIKNLFSEDNLEFKKSEILLASKIALSTSKRGIIAALEGMKIRKERLIILQHCKYPVLFIFGKKDNVLHFTTVKEQVKLVSSPSVLVLENDGHMSFLENQEICLNTISSFCRACFRGGKTKNTTSQL